jgi:hypothetical protein
MTNEKKMSYNTKNSMTEYKALIYKNFFWTLDDLWMENFALY